MTNRFYAACGLKVVAGFLTLSMLSASPALARSWWLGQSKQGIRSADVENGNASIGVTCSLTSTSVSSSIEVSLQGKQVNGNVTFAFDQGTKIQAAFRNGKMKVGTPENDRDFAAIVKRLKRSTSVAVIASGGAIRSFSLRGSRRAIGDCPVRISKPVIEKVAADPAQQAAQPTADKDVVPIFEVQKRLNLLNYDAGPEDGILSKSTRDASAAFQEDYNRPATGLLNREGIDLLYKLTDPQLERSAENHRADDSAEITTGTATQIQRPEEQKPQLPDTQVTDAIPSTDVSRLPGSIVELPNTAQPDPREALAAIQAPVEPEPATTAAITPEPAQTPVNPDLKISPEQPESIEPEPIETAAITPEPTDTSATPDIKLSPEQPEPVEPDPIETAAITPEPVETLADPDIEISPEQPLPVEPETVETTAITPEPVETPANPDIELSPEQSEQVELDPIETAAITPEPAEMPSDSDIAISPKQPLPVEPEPVETAALTPEPVETAAAPDIEVSPEQSEPVDPDPIETAAITPEPAETLSDTDVATSAEQPEPVEPEPAETAALTPALNTLSNAAKLKKTGSDEFSYHKLDQCEYERGLAAIHYFLHDQRDKVEISDLCFDRKNGVFVALESASGMTLFETLNDTDVFEIAVPDTEYFERTTVSAQRFIPFSKDPLQSGYAGSFGYNPTYNTPNTHDAQSVLMWGFVYGETSKLADIGTGDFEVHLNASNSWEHEVGAEELVRGGKKPIVLINGSGSFQNGAARLKLETKAERRGIGGGHLDLIVDAEGALTGSGEISMKNADLEGADPHDWKELNWEIVSFVGQFVGPDGQEFRGIGYISGETVDQDGFVHQAFGSVGIQGFGSDIGKRRGSSKAAGSSNSN